MLLYVFVMFCNVLLQKSALNENREDPGDPADHPGEPRVQEIFVQGSGKNPGFSGNSRDLSRTFLKHFPDFH